MTAQFEVTLGGGFGGYTCELACEIVKKYCSSWIASERISSSCNVKSNSFFFQNRFASIFLKLCFHNFISVSSPLFCIWSADIFDRWRYNRLGSKNVIVFKKVTDQRVQRTEISLLTRTVNHSKEKRENGWGDLVERKHSLDQCCSYFS